MAEDNPSEVWWLNKHNKVTTKIKSLVNHFARREPPYFSLIIEAIAKEMSPRVYVEIGVFACETFNLVSKHCEFAIGVDVSEESRKFVKGSNTLFINGTRDDLVKKFRSNPHKIDLAFIDGNHSKDEVVADFKALEPFLSTSGIIILHDTWPESEEQTQIQYCHDAWESVEILRETFEAYSFLTLPMHPGMTFAQKNSALPKWKLDQ
jgi:hypothetical protein